MKRVYVNVHGLTPKEKGMILKKVPMVCREYRNALVITVDWPEEKVGMIFEQNEVAIRDRVEELEKRVKRLEGET
jgi:folate-dependent phosphoribosylglycinamide formyltransferase PurN